MKKIVIFGASGAIGLYLTDYFMNINNHGYEIICVDKNRNDYLSSVAEFIQLDINDDEAYYSLPQKDVYAVIDLVGPMPGRMKGYHPEEYIKTNISGSYKVFQYALNASADRILYAKSFQDILKRADTQIVLKADDKPLFNYGDYHSVYCISQNTAADLLKYLHAFYGIKTFIFRLPHIYLWSNDDTYSVKGVPQKMMHRILIDQATAGDPMEVWGDPNRKKDMVYVKDLCQMFYKACFVDRNNGFYNVGTGVGTSLIDQIKGMRDVFGESKKSELVFCPEKPNAPQYIMDVSEAMTELDYHPEYSYIAMLEDMRKERTLNRF